MEIADVKKIISEDINFDVNVSDSIPYVRNGEIASDCLSIEFINTGTVNATINGRPLLVGSSPLVFAVSNGATIRTVFKLSFTTPGAGCTVLVTKMYKAEPRKKNC